MIKVRTLAASGDSVRLGSQARRLLIILGENGTLQ